MSQSISIEIVSDFVCPWCYVGKKRLERALAMRPDLRAEVSWSPFQLSPDMPRSGRNKQAHYEEIFGAQRAAQIMDSMRVTGEAEGIAFGSSPDAVSPNTLSAHVLAFWAAADPGVDTDAVIERLFAAHHVECADIGDHDTLVTIAVGAGMDGDAVRRKLATGDDEAAVRAQIELAKQRGVSGVPFFILDAQYGMSGAQPPELLVQTFDQLTAKQAAG